MKLPSFRVKKALNWSLFFRYLFAQEDGMEDLTFLPTLRVQQLFRAVAESMGIMRSPAPPKGMYSLLTAGISFNRKNSTALLRFTCTMGRVYVVSCPYIGAQLGFSLLSKTSLH